MFGGSLAAMIGSSIACQSIEYQPGFNAKHLAWTGIKIFFFFFLKLLPYQFNGQLTRYEFGFNQKSVKGRTQCPIFLYIAINKRIKSKNKYTEKIICFIPFVFYPLIYFSSTPQFKYTLLSFDSYPQVACQFYDKKGCGW